MSANIVDVKPTKRGDQWLVKVRGEAYARWRGTTQAEAVRVARGIARDNALEMMVWRKDGSLRSRDTFPEPPRLVRASCQGFVE